jgi:hypothetical protein
MDRASSFEREPDRDRHQHWHGHSIELGWRVPPLPHRSDGRIIEQRFRVNHLDALHPAGHIEDSLHDHCSLRSRLPGDFGIERRDVQNLARLTDVSADAQQLRQGGGGGGVTGPDTLRSLKRGCPVSTPGPVAMPSSTVTRAGSGFSGTISSGASVGAPVSPCGTGVGVLGGGGEDGATVSMKCACRGEPITGRSTPLVHGLNTSTVTSAAWPAIDSGKTDQCRRLRPVASPVRSTSRKNS